MNCHLNDIDALIFDMDGTLWNATESYAKIWNRTCERFGVKAEFSGRDLMQFMGMSLNEILTHLLGSTLPVEKAEFLKMLGDDEDMMMPLLGGVMFDGVKEGLEQLSQCYRLFMLSNCSARGLVNFTTFTGTVALFEGLLTQGERPFSKSENLRYMIDRYSLCNPVYVGDTQVDCDQAHEAGVPFVFAEWGFGSCRDADLRFDSIDSMVDAFIKK